MQSGDVKTVHGDSTKKRHT